MDSIRRSFTKFSSRIKRRSNRFTTSTTLCVSSVNQDVDSPHMAINACREAINILNKQELSLQSQIHIAETEARALLRLGDRGGAETSLKKREMVLREIDRLHKTRMSLLSQILLVETATARQFAVEALASGVAAHRRISRRIFEDTQLERLQDALVEQASFETDISELLEQGFDAITNFDEDTMATLKKTLADLEQDEVQNALAEASYTGMCTAESYQGTQILDIRMFPSAISFPNESAYEDAAHTQRSVYKGPLAVKCKQTMATPVNKTSPIPLSSEFVSTSATEVDKMEEEVELCSWKDDAKIGVSMACAEV